VNKRLPVPVNWAKPNWHHAAAGIRCRADWKGAHVYHTKAGWIIAYSQAHADDAAREIVEDQEIENEILDRDSNLYLFSESE
jgi:hypothetical protein